MLFLNIVSIFLTLILLSGAVFLFNSSLGGLDFASDKSIANGIITVLKCRNISAGQFCDLGSCRGGLAIKISKAMPNMTVIGFDNSRFRTFIAKGRPIFLENLSFSQEDIFKSNLSEMNMVYIYLPTELMLPLQNKLQSQLKPHSLVITHRVSFPDWKPIQIFEQLFIYQV